MRFRRLPSAIGPAASLLLAIATAAGTAGSYHDPRGFALSEGLSVTASGFYDSPAAGGWVVSGSMESGSRDGFFAVSLSVSVGDPAPMPVPAMRLLAGPPHWGSCAGPLADGRAGSPTTRQVSGGAASAASAAAASSSGMVAVRVSPSRRTVTVRVSTSRWPTARITGTLPSECSRTL